MREEGLVALVVWQEWYAIGVETIDEQHRGLFRALNDLEHALLRGDESAMLGEIVRRVGADVGLHFRTEEGLMQRIGFPGYPQHKALHEDLERQWKNVLAASKRISFSVTMDLKWFLSKWLVDHIEDEDVKIGKFIQARGRGGG